MVKKQSWKTKIATGVAVALTPFTANANHLEISASKPFENFNARANTNYSLNQLVDKVTDSLNETQTQRLAGELGKSAVAYLGAFVTHEKSHNSNTRISFNDFMPQASPDNISSLDQKQRTHYYANGINQNTFNATRIQEESVLNNESPGVAFLFNSLYLAGYAPRDSSRTQGKITNDVDGWKESLEQRGLNAPNKNKVKNLATLCAIASIPNWQAAQNVISYISRGEKNETAYLNLGDMKLTAPMFSAYLGETDVFVNSESYIKTKDGQLYSAQIGKEGNTTRIGAKVYNLPISTNLSVSPSAYLGTNGGYLAGLDFNVKTGKTSSLKIALEQSSKDLMSRVKGENGFNARASLKVKF